MPLPDNSEFAFLAGGKVCCEVDDEDAGCSGGVGS